MPDNWEKKYNLDPTKNDADKDLDEDGVSNVVEFENLTNPEKIAGLTGDLTNMETLFASKELCSSLGCICGKTGEY